MHILQLPTDVVITILSHVPAARDLCACNQVCKSIYRLFQSSPLLYHRWLLARASLVDSVYGVDRVSLSERSKLVKEIERIWHPQLLLSRRQLKVALEGPCTSYQIYNGVIAAGILSGSASSIEQLHIYRLPSYLTGLKAKLWKHSFTRGVEIDAFKMDPGQDLLVLIGTSMVASSESRSSINSTINIHLRTLSSNTCHPAASLSSLPLSCFLPKHTFEPSIGHFHNHTTIRLYRDIIGVLVKPSGDEPDISPTLIIWSWTSGQRLLTFSPPVNASVDDFTFISRETVLLTHHATSSGPALSTIRISCGRPYSKHPDLSPNLDSPLALTFFQLPNPLVCSSKCLSVNPIRILCDPVPGDSPLVTTEGNFAPSIFSPDPSVESMIVAFSFPVELHLSGAQETINHTLLVRVSSFTRFPEGTSKTPKQYTFAEWSVRGVCWLLGQPGHLFGQRYAHTSLDHPRTNVEVYDFNPCHVGTPSVPGWQSLLGQGKDRPFPTIVPKLTLSKRWGRCKSSHKRYLDTDLKSTLPCKRQTMRAGITETRVECALDHERIVTIESERGGLLPKCRGMPGPRNKPKNKKKKGNKAPPPAVTTNTEPSPSPAPQNDERDPRVVSTSVLDPGTGPRVHDLPAFLVSPFAAPPTYDDPVCDWFLDSTTYAIIEQLLPEDLSLILHYNRTRLIDRVCPACRRFYRLGDLLPLLAPEPGSIDDLDRQQEDSRTIHEQQISGLCSFVCFSLACFNYPGARGAWGRTAELLDPWTTELLNGPGAGIPDQGMSDLVKMTRNHDLGIGYMISKPWPGPPVLYEFDEDVGGDEPTPEEDDDELWVEESPYSSDSEPRGRERTVKPLGASRWR